MKNRKRRICFIITSVIHYARNFLILEELKKRRDVDLHVVLGGIVLSSKYSSHSFNVKKILEEEGYTNIHEVHFNLDGDKQVIKAKTVGLGIVEFSSIFNEINPDLVVIRGDRFEVLAAAVAAAHMNIPIAHIEGGDLSGTLDESIRHAITKLSHIHFTTNTDAYNRVLRMGERQEYVFNFGSPDVEVIKKILKNKINKNSIKLDEFGSGFDVNINKDFVIIMYHPVNSETENLSENTKNILQAVNDLGIQTIWFWPNFDAGAELISHELRIFKDEVSGHKIKFLRYLHPKEFSILLNKSKCLIGNSSAGIKECSFLGVPVVNIGSRQSNRLRSENVIDCGNSEKEIKKAIEKQIEKGRYKSSNLYHAKETSKEIAKVLVKVNLYTQKCFVDQDYEEKNL